MSFNLYAAYVVACIVIVIVPGPTVTLIVANGLRHGRGAALLNVAGTQLGLALMITIVGLGLSTVVEAIGHWFEWIRFAGAAYLVWLGWRLFRAAGAADAASAPRKPSGGFFVQGFLVAICNPKTLLFFGAFFPQFIDPAATTDCRLSSWASPRWFARRSATRPMRLPRPRRAARSPRHAFAYFPGSAAVSSLAADCGSP